MTATAAQELDAKVPDFLALVDDVEATLRKKRG
jgi:hypothetical protein